MNMDSPTKKRNRINSVRRICPEAEIDVNVSRETNTNGLLIVTVSVKRVELIENLKKVCQYYTYHSSHPVFGDVASVYIKPADFTENFAVFISEKK